MTRMQNRIANELLATYDHADSVDDLMVGNSRWLKFFFISSDCKRRYTNVFIVGPRGGLKIVKKER